MNHYLNYLIEANIGLLLFLVMYWLLLRTETAFTIKRIYLISSMLAAVIFPLVSITDNASAIPSLSSIVPSYYCPK